MMSYVYVQQPIEVQKQYQQNNYSINAEYGDSPPVEILEIEPGSIINEREQLKEKGDFSFLL